MLLKIYISFTVLMFVVFNILLHQVNKESWEKYDIEPPKENPILWLFEEFLVLLICAIPILHIIITFGAMWFSRELIDELVEDNRRKNGKE